MSDLKNNLLEDMDSAIEYAEQHNISSYIIILVNDNGEEFYYSWDITKNIQALIANIDILSLKLKLGTAETWDKKEEDEEDDLSEYDLKPVQKPPTIN